MARAGIEAIKEVILLAMVDRINNIDPLTDDNYFHRPDFVGRVEMPELQYLERTIFPDDSNLVYFIADEEGLDEEEATEDEMTEEMEVWVAVYKRIPQDKQTINPFSTDGDYLLKSTERTRLWSDFMRALAVPDNFLGIGNVENVNVTDNRPLWADVPEDLERWVGILFRVAVIFRFSKAEPWAT